MIWSKKKKLFQETLAPSLRKRLALHTSGYRDAYEERGRIWIEFDGKEILSFCDFVHENKWRELGCNLEAVAHAGVFSKYDFGVTLANYLEMSVGEALCSDNTLLTAFAVIDRRIGKRRLRVIERDSLSETARILLGLRLSAEWIEKPNKP